MDFSVVGKYHNPKIEDVLLVKNLKHNLFNINQLCKKGK